MKIGVDANLSVRIANALNALFADQNCEFIPVGIGTDDAIWISDFARQGGNAFIGLDKRILSRPNEVKALHDSGLYAFVFSFGKVMPQRHKIASRIIDWWPACASHLKDDDRVFRIPPGAKSYDKIETLRFSLRSGAPSVERRDLED